MLGVIVIDERIFGTEDSGFIHYSASFLQLSVNDGILRLS